MSLDPEKAAIYDTFVLRPPAERNPLFVEVETFLEHRLLPELAVYVAQRRREMLAHGRPPWEQIQGGREVVLKLGHGIGHGLQ